MVSTVALREQLGREVPMPDAEASIRSTLLRLDPQVRARSLLVSFPAGFARRVAGHYEAGEELLLLAGELHIGALVLSPGDWAWLPPRVPRAELTSPQGATVFAWFSASNEWIRGRSDAESSARTQFVGLQRSVGSRPLRAEGEDGVPGHSAVVAAGEIVVGPAEVIELRDPTWHDVAAGEEYRVLDGSAFVRWRST